MKIRTDFVTNSSSTSYIVSTIYYTDGSEEEADDIEWEGSMVVYLNELKLDVESLKPYTLSSKKGILEVIQKIYSQATRRSDDDDYVPALTDRIKEIKLSKVEKVVICETYEDFEVCRISELTLHLDTGEITLVKSTDRYY